MTIQKIVKREELQAIISTLQSGGKRVGFTSGVFDILHSGHVQYLADARKLCDVLVVGLNADASVKKYKDPNRPIVLERARAEVLSALSSVDYVFLFSEVNNNENVTILKPDLYIKAGDYPLEKLSSKPLVESYGGKVVTVPMKEGFSSSSIIQAIAQKYGEQHGAVFPIPHEKRPALFVDRDGTLIEHVEYLHEPEKVRCFPEAFTALKHAISLGYRIVMITNQPGIGLGYFTKEELFRVNKEVLRTASQAGVLIDKIYYCPHSKSDGCPCRKPSAALVKRAVSELNIALEQSYVIGDMTSDIQLGKNAGCKTILVGTGSAGKDGLFQVSADHTIKDFSELRDILPPAIAQQVTGEGKPVPLYDGELQTVGYVTGKLGHDFNNLIGTLLGGMDLIKSRAKKVAEGEALFEKPLTLMSAAIHKAVDLTARIRGYARPSPLELMSVSVASVLEEAQLHFRKLYGEALAITVEPFQDISVTANPFNLTRIFVSLFENSLQASRKERLCSVTIRVQQILKANKVIVSVIDTGKGMSPEEVSRAGEPFYSKKSGVGVGYGLSLAMAKLNLAKMGGALSLISEPNTGTEVIVELKG